MRCAYLIQWPLFPENSLDGSWETGDLHHLIIHLKQYNTIVPMLICFSFFSNIEIFGILLKAKNV